MATSARDEPRPDPSEVVCINPNAHPWSRRRFEAFAARWKYCLDLGPLGYRNDETRAAWMGFTNAQSTAFSVKGLEDAIPMMPDDAQYYAGLLLQELKATGC